MGLITDIIKGLPLTAVLEDKLRQLEKRYEAIETENQQLRTENRRLRSKLDDLAKNSEYEEIEGLLWKRKADGGLESKPRCPICTNHPVLFDFPPKARMHWNCSVCQGTFDWVEPPQR
jgi:hypothetical protein